MATQRDVRNRIDAVKNIQKITRAMEMVAAARLRRAEKVLVPILDVLQSIPILVFLPIALTFFIKVFPNNLLGLELATPGPQERLAPDRRFFYSVAESIDQAELLAGAVRRRLPGELGRRLARDHVLGEVRDQAERQIGRARADLQQRLAEATRQLILAVGHRYSGSTDRLARALQTATVLREQTAGQAAGTLAELAGREQALRGVLARLERLDGGGDGQDDR